MFQSIDSLNSHIVMDDFHQPFQCDVCCVTFSGLSDMMRHKAYHSSQFSRFKCDVCDKSFSRPAHLQNHKRGHCGENAFSCILCMGSFSNHGDLSRHMRIHLDDLLYKCDMCDKSFARRGHLVNHMKAHMPLQCGTCGETFATLDSMNEHISTLAYLLEIDI